MFGLSGRDQLKKANPRRTKFRWFVFLCFLVPASIFRAIKSSGADYDARVCEWLRDQAVGGKGEGQGLARGRGASLARQEWQTGKGGLGAPGLDRPPIQMNFCAFPMLPFSFCVYELVLGTWEPLSQYRVPSSCFWLTSENKLFFIFIVELQVTGTA